jgi:hypothetical protein
MGKKIPLPRALDRGRKEEIMPYNHINHTILIWFLSREISDKKPLQPGRSRKRLNKHRFVGIPYNSH